MILLAFTLLGSLFIGGISGIAFVCAIDDDERWDQPLTTYTTRHDHCASGKVKATSK